MPPVRQAWRSRARVGQSGPRVGPNCVRVVRKPHDGERPGRVAPCDRRLTFPGLDEGNNEGALALRFQSVRRRARRARCALSGTLPNSSGTSGSTSPTMGHAFFATSSRRTAAMAHTGTSWYNIALSTDQCPTWSKALSTSRLATISGRPHSCGLPEGAVVLLCPEGQTFGLPRARPSNLVRATQPLRFPAARDGQLAQRSPNIRTAMRFTPFACLFRGARGLSPISLFAATLPENPYDRPAQDPTMRWQPWSARTTTARRRTSLSIEQRL